ncbi:MAG: hypothetical protein HY247_02270 [archaeon]|nr:MAG: hypothetical protein HY247_02270 [archaeon]
MADGVVVVASFLLAFKAILIEGTEVAILAVATVKQLGRENVLLGVLMGAGGSVLVFLGVRELFVLLGGALPSGEALVSVAAGAVILYFSYRFLRGFKKYYFGKKSFQDKMAKVEEEVVEKDFVRYGADRPSVLPFSFTNSLPVFAITLTEGFEASLVLGAAGTFDFLWTIIGAAVSIVLIVLLSLAFYQSLLRFPRSVLDLVAGSVLLTFGSYFVVSGVLELILSP